MKKIVMLLAVLLSTASFAASHNDSANRLGSVWKSYSTVKPTIKNDVVMGYAGADVTRNDTVA